MKIEVFRSTSLACWYWHVVARNGKLVADSEGYNTKADAIRAAKAFVRGMIRPYAKSFPMSGEYANVLFTMKTDKHNIVTIRWQ